MVTGIFRTLVLGASLVAASGARAETRLDLGVYAPDGSTEAVWSCAAVVRAMESRISRDLGEEVVIRVHMDADYNQGVMDLTSGTVQVARFPNVETFWVLHPDFSGPLAEAWREALVKLNLEELRAAGLSTVAASGAHDASREADVANTTTLIEQRFGACAELGQRLSMSVDPARERVLGYRPFFVYAGTLDLNRYLAERATDVGFVNDLPATAAGTKGSGAQPPAEALTPGLGDCAP